MTEPDLERVRTEGLDALAAAGDLTALDAARTAHLGKKSALATAQRGLGQLAPDERRALGAEINAVRDALTHAEQARRAELEAERDRVVLAAEAVDVTLPPRTPRRGHLHPIHETMEAMVDVLIGLGYTAVTGPEVESDWFSFEALNIPRDHPARSLMDTIYVQPLTPSGSPPAGGRDAPARSRIRDDATVLRPHTSPVQARTMLAEPPPVYVAVPGRVFRQETPDATHLPVFHQMECLAVDVDLSMADLRGTLAELCRGLFGPDTRIRMRPDHYPFTEPSADVEAWLPGLGRWVELLGSGMVHPNVLRAVGYDPEEVGGFAFGMGVERVAMLRHEITDLRLFIENDVRFLAAF